MIKCTCDYCGKEFERFACEVKRAKNHFCCKQCEADWRKTLCYGTKKKNEILYGKDYAIILIESVAVFNNNPMACQVDLEDVEELSKYYWRLKYDKRHPDLTGYVETRRRGKRIFMHRLLMNPTNGQVVDHINGNTFDNRKKNLRICDQATNCLNRQDVTNIHFMKRDKIYYVHFTINRKMKVICRTKDYNEAEKYAMLGRKLINQGKLDELLNMPCKCIELPKNNTSGFLGVTKSRNKYQAWYKCKYLGTFDTPEEAYKRRLEVQEAHLLEND